jgi:hypothetical protein
LWQRLAGRCLSAPRVQIPHDHAEDLTGHASVALGHRHVGMRLVFHVAQVSILPGDEGQTPTPAPDQPGLLGSRDAGGKGPFGDVPYVPSGTALGSNGALGPDVQRAGVRLKRIGDDGLQNGT